MVLTALMLQSEAPSRRGSRASSRRISTALKKAAAQALVAQSALTRADNSVLQITTDNNAPGGEKHLELTGPPRAWLSRCSVHIHIHESDFSDRPQVPSVMRQMLPSLMRHSVQLWHSTKLQAQQMPLKTPALQRSHRPLHSQRSNRMPVPVAWPHCTAHPHLATSNSQVLNPRSKHQAPPHSSCYMPQPVNPRKLHPQLPLT